MSAFMQSKWSHCGKIKEVTPSEIYTIETSNKEVWIGRFKEYLKDEYEWELWRPKTLSEESKKDSMRIAEDLLETLYGYLQLLGFAVRCLLQRIKIPAPNWIRQGVVCCGVIFYAFHGKLKGFDVDPESRHTEDLYQLVSNTPEEWVLIAKKVGKQIIVLKND